MTWGMRRYNGFVNLRFRNRILRAGLLLVAAFSVSVKAAAPTSAPSGEKFPAYWTPVQRAGDLAFHGNYSAALAMLDENPGGDRINAAVVRAQCLAATGQTDAALNLLAAKQFAGSANAELETIRILLDAYRPDQARPKLLKFIDQNPGSIEAHYLLGAVNEQVGNLGEARKAYGWFVTQGFLARWQKDKDDPIFNSARDVVCIGRALDRLATLDNLYKSDASLNQLILDMFVRSYDVIDRGYWPAHVAAAEYFLSHDEQKKAGEELEAALSANSSDWHALQLAGRMSVEGFDFDRADNAVRKMRQVNPHSIPADMLEARSLLRQRKPANAQSLLENLVLRTPRNIEALGLLASSAALQFHKSDVNELLARIAKIAPEDATAYNELGDQLAAMRQYDSAAAMYKMAIKRAPWWSAPRNGLGLLYTQSGNEKNARTVLTAAHAIDPFNLKTTNYLRLLDDLDKLARKESAHFVIRYDAQQDAILADYLSDYMESIYPVVCGTFQQPLGVKTTIEVFPTHAEFSVRTTGMPGIDTVAACTGPVIAMVSPRGQEPQTLGTFNWAEVLRHEFTHTVTLSATKNRISQWFTEGLATWEERTPLRWEWVPMLEQGVGENKLFPIDQLTWAFIRPKQPEDRQLAYAESRWICQYIIATRGSETIVKMLAAYRRGENDARVFKDALGISDVAFFSQFSAWARQRVSAWGYDQASSEKYDQLLRQAQELIEARNYGEAISVWRQIEKLRPMEELPHKRLAGLYLQTNDKGDAIEQLKILNTLSLKNDVYAKAIARLYRDNGDAAHERDYAMNAVYIDVYDVHAHELLADAYQRLGDTVSAKKEQQVIQTMNERKQF